MNCNCKKELEAKLTERHASQYPEAKNHKAQLGSYGMAIVNNHMDIRGISPVTFTADQLVKKSGAYKPKKISSSMFWSFCPFCGKSVKEEA